MTTTVEAGEAFEAHVGPVRDGLLGLLGASAELRTTWGSLPGAGSRAMSEIASESEFAAGDPWGSEPVMQAHNLAGILLVGADDCARSACRLMSEGPAPVYSHTVLARATLEHAGRAWWLLDPRCTTRLRIARGVNERIYGLAQQELLPIPPDEKRRARDRYQALLKEGVRFSFVKRGGRRQVTFLEERRPTSTNLVRKLLGDDNDGGLGGAVYWQFSAVAHGTASGISQSIDPDFPGAPVTPGVNWGAVFTSSEDVCSVLTSMLLGLGRAIKARNELFGWQSDTWDRAYVRAMTTSRNALGL